MKTPKKKEFKPTAEEIKLWEQMLLYSSGDWSESRTDRIKRTMVKYKLSKR